MKMKCSYFVSSLSADQNFYSEIHVQIAIFLSILTNEGSKFKLDSVNLKIASFLLIDAINFELRLINFVYRLSQKTNATCLTDCNFAFSSPKLLSDGSF